MDTLVPEEQRRQGGFQLALKSSGDDMLAPLGLGFRV